MRRAVLLVMVMLVVSACGDADSSQGSSVAGPLALVPDPRGSELAISAGTMSIDERCVSLLETGVEPVTLVWPEGRTRWIKDEQAVEFTDLYGDAVVVRDGDQVELGGGGSSAAEGGGTNDAWLASVDWVAPPHDDCVFDTRWFVGDVEPQT